MVLVGTCESCCDARIGGCCKGWEGGGKAWGKGSVSFLPNCRVFSTFGGWGCLIGCFRGLPRCTAGWVLSFSNFILSRRNLSPSFFLCLAFIAISRVSLSCLVLFLSGFPKIRSMSIFFSIARSRERSFFRCLRSSKVVNNFLSSSDTPLSTLCFTLSILSRIRAALALDCAFLRARLSSKVIGLALPLPPLPLPRDFSVEVLPGLFCSDDASDDGD
mmetsp:Transcript_12326/g.26971  ORF Transcript_12326/g.26971 Transcript_12326/m.26971 type:complete len:217 (+) Transcript_12326:1169-1819(+)